MLLTRAQPEKFLRAAIVPRSDSKVGYGLEVRMLSFSKARGNTWSSHRRQKQRCDIPVSSYSPGLQQLCRVAAERKTRDRAGSEVGQHHLDQREVAQWLWTNVTLSDSEMPPYPWVCHFFMKKYMYKNAHLGVCALFEQFERSGHFLSLLV